jgi:putative addiction module CopG family antidote
MDAKPTDLSWSLPEELHQFVLERVASGQYASPSDYVSQLVQADQEQRARAELERLLKEGLESGPPILVTPEYWARLRRELAERAAQLGQTTAPRTAR